MSKTPLLSLKNTWLDIGQSFVKNEGMHNPAIMTEEAWPTKDLSDYVQWNFILRSNETGSRSRAGEVGRSLKLSPFARILFAFSENKFILNGFKRLTA